LEAGIEPIGFRPGYTGGGGVARAKSIALPADLARLIEACGALTADDRSRIRAIVEGPQA